MKRRVLHVPAGPLLSSPHTHTHTPVCRRFSPSFWANVLIPKIIIQYTFVSVDVAQRRRSESRDTAEPAGDTAVREDRHMWTLGRRDKQT